MRIGIGGLKWRPADFWSSTLTEFFEAIIGHNEAQGAEGEKKADAPTAGEMADLIARFG